MEAYRKNIVLDYIQTFTRSFNLSHAIWMIYLAYKGFSLFEIGIVEGVFHLTSFTMEIPTGVIADVFGRKISRLLSIVLYLGYLLLMISGNNLFMISLAFVFCGLSYTLESGAGDALVYDSLIEIGEEDKYIKVSGKKEIIFQIAGTLGAIIGGYIAEIDIYLVFKLMIILFIVTFIVILRMKETTVDKIKSELSIKEKFKKQYIDSFKFVMSNKRLRFLIIIMSLFTFPVTVVFFYSQNYFIELGFNEFQVGIFLGLHSFTAILGAMFVDKIKGKFSDRYILIMLPLIEIVLLWGIISDLPYVTFILLGAIESMLYVLMSDFINKIIPSDKRATILSMSSMVFSIMMIFIFPLFGLISDYMTMEYGFIFNALLISICYIFYLINYRRYMDA
ncbi:MFS transporter [Mycoplasmatota bacterium WC44]